ncbi:peroxiredoxin [Parahaliea aestuarii]
MLERGVRVRIDTGSKLPDGVFRVLEASGPAIVSAADLFSGKSVVLFSCPGAFTEKSTRLQVPSYLRYSSELFSLGVDTICCVSVNDAFVMHAWGERCEVGNKILMLADGQCEYHTQLGLEMDCTRFALGFRSHRFSLLAVDRVVRILNIEEPGAYEVSDAAVITGQIRESGIFDEGDKNDFR